MADNSEEITKSPIIQKKICTESNKENINLSNQIQKEQLWKYQDHYPNIYSVEGDQIFLNKYCPPINELISQGKIYFDSASKHYIFVSNGQEGEGLLTNVDLDKQIIFVKQYKNNIQISVICQDEGLLKQLYSQFLELNEESEEESKANIEISYIYKDNDYYFKDFNILN